MTYTTEYPKIHFPEGFDEQKAYEIPFRGYLGPISVELENGLRYPVFFVDLARLQQELMSGTQAGAFYFSEPGLVVLPEVTIETARESVQHLWKEGFFDHLKPTVASTE